jgi:uncharacterized membrane protein HdeD (DUF308 family)
MRAEGITLFDSEGKPVGQSMPTFPIVGVGSLILGVILASMPETFLNWLTYIFAAIILLVSVYQIADLIVANRYGRVGWAYWVMPIIMLLAAVVALVNPESISSSPLFFLGWAMIISGAVMIVNVLKIYTVRRAAEKRAADLAKKAESAAEVEVKEETDLIVKE